MPDVAPSPAGNGQLGVAKRANLERAVLAALGAVLVGLLGLPLACLIFGATPSELWAGLWHPLAWPALKLSFVTTAASLALSVGLGTPLAWTLATSKHPALRWLESALQLPIVIPPAVAGVALLLAFGRRGPLAAFYPEGWSVTFSTTAVVLAQTFVASPFYLQAATQAFRRIDPHLVIVARSFGATPWTLFFRLALPLSTSSLVAGAAVTWARALGEFGATLMFAGNLPGSTQTLPLAIYTVLEGDLHAAQALSVALVGTGAVVLFALRFGTKSR